MMIKWANDGSLQAYASKMLVNDGEMLFNDGVMRVWSYTHFTIINKHFTTVRFMKPYQNPVYKCIGSR